MPYKTPEQKKAYNRRYYQGRQSGHHPKPRPRSADITRRKWRGTSAELEVRKILQDLGYQARRTIMSGSNRQDPDVYAIHRDQILAVEVKSSRRDYALVPGDQIQRIRSFLDYWGLFNPRAELVGLLAVKFPHLGRRAPGTTYWTFLRLTPEDYARGRIRVPKGTPSNWIPPKVEPLIAPQPPGN